MITNLVSKEPVSRDDSGEGWPRLVNPEPLPTSWRRLLFLLFLAGSFGLSAQTQNTDDPCEFKLSQAKNAYQIGRFDEINGLLEDCLIQGFNTTQKVEALAILAKTFLAMDDLENMSNTIKRLFNEDPDYSAASDDPARFIELIGASKQGQDIFEITSVSKTSENILETPATVYVVTAEEIARRGYLDVEALLHDLPGFDITRGNGILYSNFYQRGYRSNSNDRTLFLVDGIEENDIWTNSAYLSRQFPLTNIKRVEVVYGPASTLYGPNAFAGVVNIITKDPEDLLGNRENLAVHTHLGGGAWNTGYLDLNIAGRPKGNSNLTYSLTARIYNSDEMNRSSFADWDYSPDFYPDQRADYYTTLGLTPGNPEADQLVDRAIDMDQAILNRRLDGRPVVFSDITDDWAVNGKFKLFNLLFGFQIWRREEGSNSWFTDNDRAGADQGSVWTPKQRYFFAKYEQKLNSKLDVSFFARYKQHRLADNSRSRTLQNYYNGRLSLADLEDNVEPYWQTTYFGQSATQFRGELTLVYKRSPRLTLVTGLELRDSTIQGDYIRTFRPREVVDGSDPDNPEFVPDDTDGEFFNHLDMGYFLQGVYKYSSRWSYVVGGRLDNNQVRQEAGYGSVFNPRLAVIFKPGRYIFKAIYSEAYKDASNFNRFATVPGRRDLPNPGLQPEEVINYELSGSYRAGDNLFFDAAAYRAEYSSAVGTISVPYQGGTTLQNFAIGFLEITGLQANATWNSGPYHVYGNYTFTDPKATQTLDRNGNPDPNFENRRIDDIAEHQINAGVNARYWDQLNVNLRMNWSGARRFSEKQPPGQQPFDRVDDYFVFNTAITYEGLLPNLKLQLTINNLLDNRYDHPGVRSASGSFASLQPQDERSFFLRVIYDF